MTSRDHALGSRRIERHLANLPRRRQPTRYIVGRPEAFEATPVQQVHGLRSLLGALGSAGDLRCTRCQRRWGRSVPGFTVLEPGYVKLEGRVGPEATFGVKASARRERPEARGVPRMDALELHVGVGAWLPVMAERIRVYCLTCGTAALHSVRHGDFELEG